MVNSSSPVSSMVVLMLIFIHECFSVILLNVSVMFVIKSDDTTCFVLDVCSSCYSCLLVEVCVLFSEAVWLGLCLAERL